MRSFLIISTPCFPISTPNQAWRQLSSEALPAANNPRMSFTVPSGTVSSHPPLDRLQQSEPSPGIPVCSLLPLSWGKKKNQTTHPNKTTSKSSLFLLFLHGPGDGLACLHQQVLLPHGAGSNRLCVQDQTV